MGGRDGNLAEIDQFSSPWQNVRRGRLRDEECGQLAGRSETWVHHVSCLLTASRNEGWQCVPRGAAFAVWRDSNKATGPHRHPIVVVSAAFVGRSSAVF